MTIAGEFPSAGSVCTAIMGCAREQEIVMLKVIRGRGVY